MCAPSGKPWWCCLDNVLDESSPGDRIRGDLKLVCKEEKNVAVRSKAAKTGQFRLTLKGNGVIESGVEFVGVMGGMWFFRSFASRTI